MKLHEIFKNIDIDTSYCESKWQENIDIKDLSYDTRSLESGSIFFAISGFSDNGNKYIKQSVKMGANFVVAEDISIIAHEIQECCIIVKNCRKVLAEASANFFRHPTKEIKLFGVTGTNGKTTCAFLMHSILKEFGLRLALMTTVSIQYPGKEIYTERTTQESYLIQKFLREAIDRENIDAAVIEVSSHALSLFRVHACEFDAVCFNNLDWDHQDFYQGLEPYFQAKKKLFTDYNGLGSVKKIVGTTNIEDEYGKRLMEEARIPMHSFGKTKANFNNLSLKASSAGIRGKIRDDKNQDINISSKLTAKFNVENILAAVATCAVYGISNDCIENGVMNLECIPGRLMRVDSAFDFNIFIDFAHTGSGLESVLLALKGVCEARLIVVFGAGGDKDPLRRKSMGEVSAKLADISIFTTDNPRSEDPADIIKAIEASWDSAVKDFNLNKKEKYSILDRESAIRHAFSIANSNDIICVAGKGHQQGQEIGGKVYPYNDEETIKKIINEMNHV